MDFKAFIDALAKTMDYSSLPGEYAQFEMSPEGRPSSPVSPYKAKNGAVLILLYPVKEEPHFVLTRRADYPGVHGGQVSFPGGRMEERDKDLGETACRETHEEVGVNEKNINLIGAINNLYIPPSHFMVYPFVGYLNEYPCFRLDPYEVNAIIEVPLRDLQFSSVKKFGPITLANGETLNCPYFFLKDHVVWGATAMMLNEFIHLTANLLN